eukprot:1153962-Pyramimonas_sp.AAC.1
MYVPYDPGLARLRGSLLHITDMETLLESTVGKVLFPKRDSGLCLEAGYELLRLLPTKKDLSMQGQDHLPSWLSQRRYGDPPPVRKHVAMSNSAQAGEPPSIGAWPAGDTVLLWDQLPTHRESWPLILVVDGRVLTRFSCRICQDGTLASREVPRFTDVDKAVTLVKVSD